MVRKIIKFPAPSLRRPCDWVTWDPEQYRSHIDDLRDTLAATPNGIALASNQIFEHGSRIFVVSPGTRLPEVVINPRWKPSFEDGALSEAIRVEEGCLSIPELRTLASRQSIVHLTYTTVEGGEASRIYDGLEAQIIQHECEHLDGRLLTDHLSHKQFVRLKMDAIKNRKAGK